MRQIPGVKSLPSTSKAKKSTKITFSADKIYYINVVCCVGRVEIQIEIQKGRCTANMDSIV